VARAPFLLAPNSSTSTGCQSVLKRAARKVVEARVEETFFVGAIKISRSCSGEDGRTELKLLRNLLVIKLGRFVCRAGRARSGELLLPRTRPSTVPRGRAHAPLVTSSGGEIQPYLRRTY